MNVYDERDRSSGIWWKILLAVAVILLLALVAYIPYAIQQQRINDLEAQVSNLKSLAATQSTQSQQSSQPTTTQTSGSTFTSTHGVSIKLYSPAANATVVSPVAVIGEVPGNWSSDASFPVKLTDSKGNVVAQTTGHVLGNNQTSQLVPFSAQLTYSVKPTGKGTLVLEKAVASGQSSSSDSVSIPVNF